MRPLIVDAAKDKFGQSVQVKPLVDLKSDEDEDRKENILIIGTIFKQQERKPSILSELSEEAGVEFQPPHTVYTADTDSLVLEDESMRVKLVHMTRIAGAKLLNCLSLLNVDLLESPINPSGKRKRHFVEF